MKIKRLLLPLAFLLTLIGTSFGAGKPVSDDFLIDTIRQKLASDTVVKGGAIEVVVKDGAVILKGTVDEPRQKSRAEKLTKKVNGVKSVDNELQIAKP